MRHLTVSARLAGMLLLCVWVGPVSFVQTDTWQILRWAGAPGPASAEQQVIPAGQALVLAPGTPIRLLLEDGSAVQGRFLGRTLLDSALYAPRFAAYARSSDFVPFALGETLHVSLRDGREWTASFAGYGELSLLLAFANGPGALRLPFEFAREIRGANGAWVEPKALVRAFHKGSLPSAEALVLGERGGVGSGPEEWESALRVAVEDIRSAVVDLPSGGSVAGAVLIGVVATVIILYVMIAASHRQASTGCDFSPAISGFGGGLSLELTPRPYDRSLSRYVDDPPPVAETWPGETEVPPATASSDPTRPSVAAEPQNTVDRLNW